MEPETKEETQAEKVEKHKTFVEKYAKEIKHFGMLRCLLSFPHIVLFLCALSCCLFIINSCIKMFISWAVCRIFHSFTVPNLKGNFLT